MASGLPIVTTPEGIEGIPAKNGREVVVENNLTRLAKQAVKVLSDQIWAKKIGRGGKRLVKSKYDWKKSAERLSALYEKICRH
jgi:glycosyltransferase involved in cell wall biosynthesis